MTKDKARKRATRERAGGTRDRRTDMSYTEAHRTDSHRDDPEAGSHGALPLGQIEEYLDEAEQLFRSDDPYQRQSGYAHASRLYGELAAHTDSPTSAMAAIMAGQMYAVLAAQTRFEHGIPTLYPKTEATNLHLGRCGHCERPWRPVLTARANTVPACCSAQHPEMLTRQDTCPKVNRSTWTRSSSTARSHDRLTRQCPKASSAGSGPFGALNLRRRLRTSTRQVVPVTAVTQSCLSLRRSYTRTGPCPP